MKKSLLIAGFALCAMNLSAQKYVLYESFSGENCGPCAAANPILWGKMTSNTDKILLIKYQTPIPSAGPIYYQNTADPQTRRSYYGVNSAPNGRMDGRLVNGQTHPNTLTQQHIDDASTLPTDFDITVAHSYYANGDSMLINIDIEALNAVNADSLRLHVALVESLYFETPPGSNGETEFHNTVRKMYPSANGTEINSTWTASQTEHLSMEVAIPDYVDLQGEVFIVVWIQENKGTDNKYILQAARSATVDLDYDLSIKSIAPYITCQETTIDHKVFLKNLGTETVTSVDIYSKLGNGAFQQYTYTDTLYPNDTATVTVGTFNIGAGQLVFTDSIGLINTSEIDINSFNDQNIKTTYNFDANAVLPIGSNFNSSLPNNWIVTSDDKRLKSEAGNWRAVNLGSSGSSHDDSKGVLVCENYFAPVNGYKAFLYLPLTNLPGGAKAIDFYFAYALRGNFGLNESLELAYSQDCGESWTSLWKETGAELATAAATQPSSFFIPKKDQWDFRSIDATDITGETIVAFIAQSNFGNHMFLDNINLRSGAVNSINENNFVTKFSVYPNPVQEKLNVNFALENTQAVTISVVNMLGQEVLNPISGKYKAGEHHLTVETSDLTNGIYMISININGQTKVEKFVVNK